jgi:hypothetical protein
MYVPKMNKTRKNYFIFSGKILLIADIKVNFNAYSAIPDPNSFF